MLNVLRVLGLIALASFAAPVADAQDVHAGEAVFKSQCSACHAVDTHNRVGPSLQGLFGRTSGTVPGYSYSAANKAKAIVWTAQTLDPYIKSPKTVIPGTKMPYAGLADDTKRADLIAWLEVATKPPSGTTAPPAQ